MARWRLQWPRRRQQQQQRSPISKKKSASASSSSSSSSDHHCLSSTERFVEGSSRLPEECTSLRPPVSTRHPQHKDDDENGTPLAPTCNVLEAQKEDSTPPPDATTAATALTRNEVYDFVWAYMEEFTKAAKFAQEADASRREVWNAFLKDHHTPDYLLVRPSGNTLDLAGLWGLFASGDVTRYAEEVMAVESIKVLSAGAAVVVFRTEQEFWYKGAKEEDFCTWTAVVVWHNDRLKITNIHRSSGKNVHAVYTSGRELNPV